MILDYWAHAHLDDPKLREQDTTDNFEEQREAMEAEMAEAGAPVMLDPAIARMLAAAKGPTATVIKTATAETPLPPGVSVTQEVVQGKPEDNDFETVADDRWP